MARNESMFWEVLQRNYNIEMGNASKEELLKDIQVYLNHIQIQSVLKFSQQGVGEN